jgi:hypothetical protein
MVVEARRWRTTEGFKALIILDFFLHEPPAAPSRLFFREGGPTTAPTWKCAIGITTAPHTAAEAAKIPAIPAISPDWRPAPQRHALIRDLPIYVDRRQSQEDFILDQLEANPRVPAILEANGGSTAWGKEGLLKTAEFILLLEEGAQVQHLAQTLGGSREYGPNVLALQWKRRN